MSCGSLGFSEVDARAALLLVCLSAAMGDLAREACRTRIAVLASSYRYVNAMAEMLAAQEYGIHIIMID